MRGGPSPPPINMMGPPPLADSQVGQVHSLLYRLSRSPDAMVQQLLSQPQGHEAVIRALQTVMGPGNSGVAHLPPELQHDCRIVHAAVLRHQENTRQITRQLQDNM